MALSTNRPSTNVRLANVGSLIQSAGMFKKRLDVQEAYGQTALYDALAASPDLYK